MSGSNLSTIMAERLKMQQRAMFLISQGVWVVDPARFDSRGTLTCGKKVFIDVGCIFEGEVDVGEGAMIGAYCYITDAKIAPGAVIKPFSHIAGAVIGAKAEVGPFARLRPGANLGEEVHVGNFVEIKNSTLHKGAKANHLAYVGDAELGERVNFGAGAITANYDGANKHKTIVESDVHVGSNAVLVAPVMIERGATIAAGSVVSKLVTGGLTIVRGLMINKPGWKRPQKKEK